MSKLLLLLSLLIFFFTPHQALANMVVPPEVILTWSGMFLLIVAGVGFLNALIEFVVIYVVLKKKVIRLSALFKAVVVTNLFTFLPTQLFSIFIFSLTNINTDPTSTPLYWTIYIAEILPFTLEFYLFKWQFTKLNKNGYLQEVTSKDILLAVFLANLTTGIISATFLMLGSI